MEFNVFGRKINISDEDMQWVRDQDAYMNPWNAEFYLECFFDADDDKEKILEIIKAYTDEELSKVTVEAAKKYITREAEQRGTLFVRNDLLKEWLYRVYDSENFTDRDQTATCDVLKSERTVPFMEFAARPEDIELLFKHYYISFAEETPFDDWMFLEHMPKDPDRCLKSEYIVRSAVRPDEKSYQFWEKENDPGTEPLEHILRFDVMRSKFCRSDRLWIGGTKEKIVIYFYGRDSHGYDKILNLEPRDENDDWDPSVLWSIREEMPRYRYHRENDLFIWESKERRVIFSQPDMLLEECICFFADRDDIGSFNFDILSEAGWISDGKRVEEKNFKLGFSNDRIFDFRDILNRMLYMPASIAGTNTGRSGLFHWTESTRILDAFNYSGNDVFTVTKMEKADGTAARFDIMITDYEDDFNYCSDSIERNCWEDQGFGDSFGLFGLCTADVLQLLKCLDEFIRYAWEKTICEYRQYVMKVDRNSGSLTEWAARPDRLKPDELEWWEIIFRPYHYVYYDEDSNYSVYYDDYAFEIQANVTERMKEAGFMTVKEQANIFHTKNIPNLCFDELKEMLEKITADPWVRENICFIGIKIEPYW